MDAIDGKHVTATVEGRETGDLPEECGSLVPNGNSSAAHVNLVEPPGEDVHVDAADC